MTRASPVPPIFLTWRLTEAEMEERPKRILVIGVGNVHRGDDGVGILVVRLVRESVHGQLRTLEIPGEPLGMLDAWCEADQVFIVDAIQSSDSTLGQVHRWDVHEAAVPAREYRHSSHALSVAQVIELARSLGTLPPSAVVYGVRAGSFVPGEAPSPAVMAGAQEATDRIIAEIRAPQTRFIGRS